jgi:hypothetical protein
MHLYHPLFVFNQFGDLERCALRPGNCSQRRPIKDWSLTSLKEKLIKIGAKVVSHGRTRLPDILRDLIRLQMHGPSSRNQFSRNSPISFSFADFETASPWPAKKKIGAFPRVQRRRSRSSMSRNPPALGVNATWRRSSDSNPLSHRTP